MYEQEKITPYGSGEEKKRQVEQMFDNIAPTYDRLNHRLSGDIDRRWRRKAIRQLMPFQPKQMLDIATGTGDFAILAAKMLNPERLIGADISGERQSAKGRADAILMDKGGVYVFEFKYGKTAKEAVDQARAKDYAGPWLDGNPPVFYVGVNYDPGKRGIDAPLVEKA